MTSCRSVRYGPRVPPTRPPLKCSRQSAVSSRQSAESRCSSFRLLNPESWFGPCLQEPALLFPESRILNPALPHLPPTAYHLPCTDYHIPSLVSRAKTPDSQEQECRGGRDPALRDAGGHATKMIEAGKMPQPGHAKILPRPQAASACRRHHKPTSAPPTSQ
jgi:hypothetical protein